MVTNNNQVKSTGDTSTASSVVSTANQGAKVVNTQQPQVVDHANVDAAVKNAESVKVNVQQGTAEKQADGTYKYATSTHQENAVSVQQTATQNVNDKATAEKDYQSQVNSINQTTNQAKQNVQKYEQEMQQYNAQTQQNVDAYDVTKKAVDANNASLQQQVAQLKQQGVNVTENSSPKVVSNVNDANQDYQANKAKLDQIAKIQGASQATYQQAMAKYNQQLNTYNALKKQVDLNNAQNSVPEVVSTALTTAQNGVVSVDGCAQSLYDNASTYWLALKQLKPVMYKTIVLGYQDTTDKMDITWKNVGVDPVTGKKLNLTYTLSNFVVPKAATWHGQISDKVSSSFRPTITVNQSGIGLGYNQIVAMRVKVTLTDEDGTPFNGPLSIAVDGLDKLTKNDGHDIKSWSQYVNPVSDVNGVYRDPSSLIAANKQTVKGVADALDSSAYMVNANVVNANDKTNDPDKQLGIVLTGNNGLTYDVGTSKTDSADIDKVVYYVNTKEYLNHVRSSIKWIIPPTKPTMNSASVTYNLDTVAPLTIIKAPIYAPVSVKYHYDQLISHEGTPKPVKHVDNTQGQQIDENFVKQGQELDYKVSWDLSDDQNVVVSDQMKAAGLGIEDMIDSRLTPKVSGVKVADAKGNVISNDEFNITDDNGTIKVMAKDPQAFINQYQGQKLTVSIPTTVNEDVTGEIPNEAIEDHFGNQVKTNIVKVYIPVPHKDVEAGTVDGVNIKQSVDGKQVIKGEVITFPLTTSALPAGREEDIKSYVVTDKLDSNFDYSSCKAFLNGKDVTNMYTIKNDHGTLTLTANDDLLKLMNADQSKDFQMPVIDIYGSAKASGVTIKNQYVESFNNKAYESNTVSVHTPNSPKPTKNVDDANGNNIEAHFVSQDQPVNFTIGFDLTQDKNLVLDPASIAKGLDIEDDIDNRLSIHANGIKVTDAKDAVIDSKDFDITDSNNQVMVKVKDPQVFIDQYGGQMLSVMIPTTTKTGVTGDIYNTAVENHFGDHQKTNQVVVYIPAPHKDVLTGTVQGTSSNSIDGKNVVKGQAITFPLTTSALPAGRKEDIKSYVIKDVLDSNFKYDSFQAFSNGKDVTSEFVPALTQGQDGKWTLTLTATDQLLKEMNADKSKAFDIPIVDLYGSANASGVTIKNDYQEILNGHDYQSNTVTVHTTPAEKPTKEVDDAQGDNIDNDNVEDGDMLNYKVTMDLSGLKEATLTPDTIAKGLSIIDTLPIGVTLQQGAVKVTAPDGKTDLTSMFNVTVSGNKVTVAAKDSARLVAEYGDQKLIVTLPSQVNDGFTGDLTNIAEQNTFGNVEETNQVVNHVPNIKPDKDVVIDTLSKNSLNNQTVKYGQVFDYKLHVSRPANYGGTTTSWQVVDHMSNKDEFTGQYKVISTCPITLENGQVLPTGSDITKYFTMSYDGDTNTVTETATPEFIKIANLPANKKVEFGYTVYNQCKRVGYGEISDVFQEYYNGHLKNSNIVVTYTPKLATPVVPKPETPAVVTPVIPVKKTPAPKPKPAAVKPEAKPALAKPAPKAKPVVKPEVKSVAKLVPAPGKPAVAKGQRVGKGLPQTGESQFDHEALAIVSALLGLVALLRLKSHKE